MHISKIRIKNYKSFVDSGGTHFSPGVNVIIGPNSAGKTALLQAVSLRIKNSPTRDHPNRDFRTKETQVSTIDVKVTIPLPA
jgi:predicted ATP-dependent endonuclease of OLD family